MLSNEWGVPQSTEEIPEVDVNKKSKEEKRKIRIGVLLFYSFILLIAFGLFNFQEITKNLNFNSNKMSESSPDKKDKTSNLSPQTMHVSSKFDYLAPDSSEIRLLPRMKNGSMAHCVLPAYQTSKAVVHKTVEEIWYIIEGNGMIWRNYNGNDSVEGLSPGVSITIPVGTKFQFQNIGKEPLKIVIATMPPWPEDKEEAVVVEGFWSIVH